MSRETCSKYNFVCNKKNNVNKISRYNFRLFKCYDEYAQSVVGENKEAVIKNMGMPTREYKISDKLHLLHYDCSTRNSFITRISNRNWAWGLFFETFFSGGRDMGKALKERMKQGFTFLKMDLGIELLIDQPGCLSAPLGFLDKMKEYKKTVFSTPGGSIDPRAMRGEAFLFDTYLMELCFSQVH